MAQDTIDLFGHRGLGRKTETHFCEVDKTLNRTLKNGRTYSLQDKCAQTVGKNALHALVFRFTVVTTLSVSRRKPLSCFYNSTFNLLLSSNNQ